MDAVDGRTALSESNCPPIAVTPNFTLLLASGVVFAVFVLGFIYWRFSGPDALAFALIAGGFSACMDFLSSFAARNYEYPGQSPLWVFSYIFFGWIGMCGTSLLMAEGIVVRPGQDLLSELRFLWLVPLATAVIAILVDLFLDPVAVAIGYWVWFVPGQVYFGIPLLNFVGWFVLMFLAPLTWLAIARQQHWGYRQKALTALAAYLPLGFTAAVLSYGLNGIVTALGLQ
jgi:putative membrane protein